MKKRVTNRTQTENGESEDSPQIADSKSGARRDRTVDLLNAIQALSQLSYSPIGLIAYRLTIGRTINKTFNQFVKEKRYLKNYSPHTLSYPGYCFKALCKDKISNTLMTME